MHCAILTAHFTCHPLPSPSILSADTLELASYRTISGKKPLLTLGLSLVSVAFSWALKAYYTEPLGLRTLS